MATNENYGPAPVANGRGSGILGFARKLAARMAAIAILAALLSAGTAGSAGARPAERHEKPIHGGTLYAIGHCDVGHIELILDEGTMEVWIQSEGTGILRPARVEDHSIKLKLTVERAAIPDVITLEAAPLREYGESKGDCSHFIGYSPAISKPGVRFSASGTVYLNGVSQRISFEYPPVDENRYY